MKYEIQNSKINDILDDLSEEYRNLLIEKTLFEHQEYDVDELNLSTLIKLDEKAKELLLIDERNNRRNRMLAMLSVVGLIYTLFGLIVLIYSYFGDSFRFDSMTIVSFVSIFVGLFASLFSLIIKTIPYSSHLKREDTSRYFNYKVINAWKQIEGLLVQLTPVEKNMSISKMVINLMELKLLSSEDESTIKKLLGLRNQIVHSSSIEKRYTTKEIQVILHDSDKIIKKLQKFESN